MRCRRLGLVTAAFTLVGCAAEAPATMLRVPAWADQPVETICLHVDEVYEDAGSITPYADAITFAVEHTIGYPASPDLPPRIVESGCDVSVTVSMRGRAVHASYVNFGGLYTGWDVSGTITVESDGHEPLLVRVAETKAPPDTVRYADEDDADRQPADAIVAASRSGDWCRAFASLFRPSDGTRQFMPVSCRP